MTDPAPCAGFTDRIDYDGGGHVCWRRDGAILRFHFGGRARNVATVQSFAARAAAHLAEREALRISAAPAKLREFLFYTAGIVLLAASITLEVFEVYFWSTILWLAAVVALVKGYRLQSARHRADPWAADPFV